MQLNSNKNNIGIDLKYLRYSLLSNFLQMHIQGKLWHCKYWAHVRVCDKLEGQRQWSVQWDSFKPLLCKKVCSVWFFFVA